MKISIRPVFSLFILLQLSFCAVAQKERIDDLIPFRGKTKWGLVHHDGKLFYKPVFDSIVNFATVKSVYDKDELGDSTATVLMKGEKFVLNREKKLISWNEFVAALSGKKIEENERVFTKVDMNDMTIIDSYIEKSINKMYIGSRGTWVKTPEGKRVNIRRRKDDGPEKVEIFIDDKIMEAFTNSSYSFADSDRQRGRYRYLIMRNGHYQGCADLETGQVVVPFAYSGLDFCESYQDWLIAEQNQLINMKNEKIGRRFSRMKELHFPSVGKQPAVFTVSDSAGKYAFYYPLADTLSQERYSWLGEVFSQRKYYTDFNIKTALFIVEKDGKQGVMDLDRTMKVPFQSISIQTYGYSRFLRTESGKKHGFIDLSNLTIIAPTYDRLQSVGQMNFQVKGLPYNVFLANNAGVNFYIDNFGHEFIEK
jgi:hypothetical protein